MTLQEAKEKIAGQSIYKRWENIKDELRGTDEYIEFLEAAAELYAKEAADKAWEAGYIKGKYEASEVIAYYLGVDMAIVVTDKETFMKELFKDHG